SSARFPVGQPVDRRYVLVRTGHLYAGCSANRRLLLRSRRHHRVRPLQFLLDAEVHLLHIGWRRVVASVQKDKHTWMIAQPRDLIAQRRRGDSVLIPFPIVPTLPRIATGPAGHNQNPKLVGLVEEFVAVEAP